ncbi:MAG: META domain-containing protein [Chlorobium sp.]|nr:META domain-containing protein [Chlorobium phaeovibrioides]NQU46042.1 META domain-containing protein [Chlorobium sp.]
MMMRERCGLFFGRLPLLAGVMAMLLIVGCARQAGSPESVSKLTETAWRAVEVDGQRVEFLPGQKLDVSLVMHRTGRIRGATGCNNLSGSFSQESDGLIFSSLATTRMACAKKLMVRERLFLQALRRTARWSVSSRTLTLYDAMGSRVARFMAVDGR